MKNVKGMNLLMVGTSNWDYYLDHSFNLVIAKVKPEEQYRGCSDCTFGTIKYFSEYLRRQCQKDEALTSKLTDIGFACLSYGAEDPHRLKNYVLKNYINQEEDYENTTKRGSNIKCLII